LEVRAAHGERLFRGLQIQLELALVQRGQRLPLPHELAPLDLERVDPPADPGGCRDFLLNHQIRGDRQRPRGRGRRGRWRTGADSCERKEGDSDERLTSKPDWIARDFFLRSVWNGMIQKLPDRIPSEDRKSTR